MNKHPAHSGIYRTTLELPDAHGNYTERPFEVHYEYLPGCRGLREAGRQIEPDFGPEMDITGVMDSLGRDHYGLVSEHGMLPKLEEQILQWLHEGQ